jgi:hypothetical protein
MVTVMATAMTMATEMATAIAMTMATATATMTLSLQRHHQGRVISSCASNVQCCGRGDALPPPSGHKGVCISQRCAMGVPLQRVFAPFQGGGILRAHHGWCFVHFFHLPVQFNPLFPNSNSVLQEPCQLIDGLPQLLLYFLSR